VTELGLGTFGLRLLDERNAFEVLNTFYLGGGRVIDTAAAYGAGDVERLIGRWLEATGAEVHLTTKVGYFTDPLDHRSTDAVVAAVHASAERLGRVPDAVLLHDADWSAWGLVPGEGDPGPAWSALLRVGRELGFVPGVSGNDAARLRSLIIRHDVAEILVAKQYDSLWRSAETLLDEAGRVVRLGAPFHQGHVLDLPRLGETFANRGDYRGAAAARQLGAILREAGVDPLCAALATAWDSRAAAVVVGMRSPAEVATGLAGPVRLSSGVRRAIEENRIFHAPMQGLSHAAVAASVREPVRH